MSLQEPIPEGEQQRSSAHRQPALCRCLDAVRIIRECMLEHREATHLCSALSASNMVKRQTLDVVSQARHLTADSALDDKINCFISEDLYAFSFACPSSSLDPERTGSSSSTSAAADL